MSCKPKTALARLILNISVIYAIFYNHELMLQICGPFTHPVQPKLHLIVLIVFMELVRVLYSWLFAALRRIPLVGSWTQLVQQFVTLKYFIVLLFKFAISLQNDHRKKFYLHALILQGTIIITTIVLDCFRKPNIAQAGELLIVQGLHRTALLYELTQTFCPNLVLYYMTGNLLVFVLAQLQGQQLFDLKQSLFVKHDIYRLMLILFVYFGCVGAAQLSIYGGKTLLVFLMSLKLMHMAVSRFNEKIVSWSLVGIALLLSLAQLIDSNWSQL